MSILDPKTQRGVQVHKIQFPPPPPPFYFEVTNNSTGGRGTFRKSGKRNVAYLKVKFEVPDWNADSSSQVFLTLTDVSIILFNTHS